MILYERNIVSLDPHYSILGNPGHYLGAQWLRGRVLDSRTKGGRLEPHRRHCVVSLSKNINPSLVLVQPRKTRPYITERLLMGRKESNQTNKNNSKLSLTYSSNKSILQCDEIFFV